MALIAFYSNSLSASVEGTELIVEMIDLNNVNKSQVDPIFLELLEKYKRGVHIAVENLPDQLSEFNVIIDRPLFKEGFLGYSYDKLIRKYSVTKEELLENQKQFSSSHPIVDSFVCAGYLPGEEINLSLLTNENKLIANTSFIPNPLEKTFSDGKAKISLEFSGGQASRYKVFLSGFKDNEPITFQSISGTEEIPPQTFRIKKNIGFFYSNGVVGAYGGKSILSFQRESGEKAVFILPWGNQLLPYLEGKVAFGEIP